VIALLVGAAWAAEYSSTPQPVVFVDTHDAFDVVAFDTGYLPDISDPVSVRFHITPAGGVTSVMDAQSHLEWPELAHEVVGELGTGELAIDTRVEIEAEVYINLPLLYSGSISLWSEEVALYAMSEFDPLLVGAEEPAEVRLDGLGLIEPLELALNIIFGVDLVFAADFYPTIEADLMGQRIDAQSPHAVWSQEADGEAVAIPLPGEHEGALPVTLSYQAEVGTVFSFVIEPYASLDTIIGDFELLRFPIDVPLVDASELRTFESVEVVHPLPALGGTLEGIDFGAQGVGTLANANVEFPNLGELPLSGTARVEGDPSFGVWPEDLLALGGQTDGVVVSFLPSEAGVLVADLVFTSNDPGVPEWRVPLVGEGLVDETSPGTTGMSTGTTAVESGVQDDSPALTLPPVPPTRECGCSAGASRFSALWPMLLLLLGVRRRPSRT
jgi:hypothetical protein